MLKEFAVYLPEVGYTQGLNYVGGYLLLFGVREIDTLRCLIGLNLHEDLMLMGLYTDLFPLCQLYCSLFWVALSQMMPPLYDTLRKDAELQDYVWLYPWFLTLFIRELPI